MLVHNFILIWKKKSLTHKLVKILKTLVNLSLQLYVMFIRNQSWVLWGKGRTVWCLGIPALTFSRPISCDFVLNDCFTVSCSSVSSSEWKWIMRPLTDLASLFGPCREISTTTDRHPVILKSYRCSDNTITFFWIWIVWIWSGHHVINWKQLPNSLLPRCHEENHGCRVMCMISAQPAFTVVTASPSTKSVSSRKLDQLSVALWSITELGTVPVLLA